MFLLKGRSLFQRVCILCSIAYVAGFLFMLLVRPGSKDTFETIFSLLHLSPHTFAGVCCLVYARRGRHSTRAQGLAWLLIGMACFAYLAGDFAYYYYANVCGGPVPCPSWADVAWVSVFPFIIGGVLLLFRSMPRAGRARLLFDSAILTSSIGVLVWHFLLRQLWRHSGLALLGKIVSVSYPLGDVASLFSALVLLNSMSDDRHLRRSLGLLACGIISWAFADTPYTYYRFLSRYHMGSWYDWGWPFGALLIAYASLSLLWARHRGIQPQANALHVQSAQARSLVRLFAPYAAAGISLTVVITADSLDGGGISAAMFFVGLGMMALVLLRQVFTLLENRDLTRQLSDQLQQNQELAAQLRALNEGLEQRVEQRTQQLGALLGLTQAVNNTLQVKDVLAAALEHTQRAFQAEAVAVWLSDESAGSSKVTTLPLHKGLEEHTSILAFLARQAVRDQVELLPLPTATETQPGVCLRAPLIWQQKALGMIGIVRWEASIDPTEWGLLQSIGLEVGTALENAYRHRAALEAADKDPVTNLYNHRAIHQHLDRELARAYQLERPLAVVMMDLNNFKMFNDTYGHPVGDQVLRGVAQALRETCRETDYAGRYGGDEFLLILPDTGAEGAVTVAERLQARMLQQGYRRSGEGRTIPVSLSFGIAAFPEDSVNRHELLTIADNNLYTAKQSESGIHGTTEMQRANRRLRAASGSFNVLDAMVTAVDNKDRYTRRHSEDVTEYALWTAEELGVSEETLRLIRIGGLLHDVGKIGVPDEILHKPGRLTPEEYEVMKRHPRLGALIVGAVPGMEEIVDAVRSHHERWDGQGYPDGTKGEDTPFLGRLLAVADAFSAMTTDRPYRRGMDWDTALGEIKANIGTQFDPAIAQAFLRAAEKRRPAGAPQPAAAPAPVRLAA
ncbi:MAG TPA: diguanylate cyclase [Chthonomonadaceae bacterium]|nr:diguanylate cyclase [Chthonomonadaceae bacterium]